jgi:trk system potassium uptake protein
LAENLPDHLPAPAGATGLERPRPFGMPGGSSRDDRAAGEVARSRGRKDKEKEGKEAGVLLIGLGRFGSSIALTLDRLGHDVLAVEKSAQLIQQYTGRFPLVEADATNPDALRQLGAKEFSVAVVGVGTSLEASVLITGNLVDLGTPQIWAKAISAEHARILHRIGAHHVVLPEADAGNRVAHLVSGKLLDYIEVEDGFTIVKMRPPRETQGFTIGQSRIRERYGVTVIGVKPPGEDFLYATDQTRISANDILIVSGHADLLERFAARP